jgi:hypothetical protein
MTNMSDELIAVTSVGRQELWIPVDEMWLPVASPSPAGAIAQHQATAWQGISRYIPFDDSTLEAAMFNVALPKRWDVGNITCKFYWITSSTNAGDVYWRMNVGTYGDGDLASGAFLGTLSGLDTANGTQYDYHISPESGAQSFASGADGDVIQCMPYRDAADGSDTHTGDAWLVGVKLFWTSNALTDD